MNNKDCTFYNIGCDFHTRFQQVTYRDKETGQIKPMKLQREGEAVRNFYASLAKDVRVRVGIESTGYSLWFDPLLTELGIERIGRGSGRRAWRCWSS